ncbi:MAG TPA: hypothetical protein ENJ32_13300 [Crenotrichaceae bacterium]|nr:hypothetical protein [Crenotrichaceae bacterium]
MADKEFFSAVAIALTLIAYFPYIQSVLQNQIKPHVFSWIIWGSTTFIVFLAQLEGGGGIGAWPIGVSGVITVFVALLAYIKKSDISITKTDWCFFVSAMASIPFWFFTSDPLWAVLILTSVDILGFGPTVRKAFFHPYQEDALFFSVFMVRNLVSLMALEFYSLTTVLFPAAIAGASFILVSMILFRRRVIVKKK